MRRGMVNDNRSVRPADAALEALLEELHRSEGVWYRIVDRPDERVRDGQAVDYILEAREVQIAVEHTVVESFPGQIQDYERVKRILEPLTSSLPSRLPRSWFHLVAQPGAVAGLKPEQTREAVADWVERVGPTLREGNPRTAPEHFAAGRLPELPFEANLYRWPERRDRGAEFTFLYDPPEDLEGQRVERMKKALSDKCPKLEAARDGTRRTILILEDRDLAMSNVVTNTSAYAQAIDELKVPKPDAVYWIDMPFPPGLAYRIDA